MDLSKTFLPKYFDTILQKKFNSFYDQTNCDVQTLKYFAKIYITNILLLKIN